MDAKAQVDTRTGKSGADVSELQKVLTSLWNKPDKSEDSKKMLIECAIALEFKSMGDFSQIALTKFLHEHSEKLTKANVGKDFNFNINLNDFAIAIFFADKVHDFLEEEDGLFESEKGDNNGADAYKFLILSFEEYYGKGAVEYIIKNLGYFGINKADLETFLKNRKLEIKEHYKRANTIDSWIKNAHRVIDHLLSKQGKKAVYNLDLAASAEASVWKHQHQHQHQSQVN